jgi:hypothetical protein
MRTLAVLTFAVLAVGCTQTQQPYSFTTPTATTPEDKSFDNLARAMVNAGQSPSDVNREAGILTTRWTDTGFKFGSINGTDATLVRRYTVTMGPGEGMSNITIRADIKKCQQGGFSIGETDIRGPCETVEGIPEKHQQELNTFGEELKRTMGTVVTAPTTPTSG